MSNLSNSSRMRECGRLIISADSTHVPLPGSSVSLGRCPRCSQLTFPGPSISRCHCRIVVESGTVIIEDLNSRNGTWLNGSRIQRAPLVNGAVVHLGLEQFVFEECHRRLREESACVLQWLNPEPTH